MTQGGAIPDRAREGDATEGGEIEADRHREMGDES
jgi:hypothetical protein